MPGSHIFQIPILLTVGAISPFRRLHEKPRLVLTSEVEPKWRENNIIVAGDFIPFEEFQYDEFALSTSDNISPNPEFNLLGSLAIWLLVDSNTPKSNQEVASNFDQTEQEDIRKIISISWVRSNPDTAMKDLDSLEQLAENQDNERLVENSKRSKTLR